MIVEKVLSQNCIECWKLLQNTEYKNGFSADDPAVRMFWSVFHEDLSLEDKKKFLRECTALLQNIIL